MSVVDRLQRTRAAWSVAAAGWAELRDSGAALVARIGGARAVALQRAARSWETESGGDEEAYTLQQSDLCARLAVITEGLQAQLARLQQLAGQLQAMQQLQTLSSGGDGGSYSAADWDAARCADVASQLLPLYEREMRVKSTVAVSVAHAASEEVVRSMEAAWKYDACLSPHSHALEQCLCGIAMLCRRLLPLHHPCGPRGLCGAASPVVPDTILSPQRRAEFIDRVSRQKLRLPAGDGSAPGAAVLAALCRLHGTPGLLFTLRSSALNKHAGQVSFPGGKRDDEDEDLLATALRETWEELGLRVEREQVWTQLPAMLSHRLGRKPVATFVADVGEVEIDRLRPEPTEVEDVFVLSLDHLCRPQNYGQTQWRLANSPGYVMPAYINGPHRVWGFTAIMTHVLLLNLLPEVYSHKVRMIKPVPVDG